MSGRDTGKTAELIRVHLVVRDPPGTRHGGVSARLTYLLGDHGYRNELGTPFPPDLAAEIVSPNDRLGALLTKIGQLLDTGTRLVWVIDPSPAQAVVPCARAW